MDGFEMHFGIIAGRLFKNELDRGMRKRETSG